MIKIKIRNSKISFSFKDVLSWVLIFFIIIIAYSLLIYGIETTARMTQSFGIGFGSLFAGLAGLTAFLDWLEKTNRSEKYIKELKEKYPRNLLKDGTLKIVQKENTDMVYLLDKRDNTIHWFKDHEARRDLDFTQSDTSETISTEEFSKYTEVSPIAAKKDYY